MRRNLLFPLACFLLFLLLPPALSAQERSVSGTVLADDGTPMPGVTVSNQTNGKKTQTNSVGYYSIEAATGQKLHFTFVGYVAQTLTVPAGTLVNVKLVSAENDMENVVVTGYGQKRNKRELAYQAPTVSGEEIAQTRRSNFLNALAGRVPGLTVTSTSGLPGASAQIMLRGGTSIGGSNQPLFVIDGMPVIDASMDQNDLPSASNTGGSAATLSMANRNSDYTNRIADMNPEDIESVTILKGPEATALYGSDGAGGAIVITTKKGKTGKTQLTYTGTVSLAQVYRYPQTQSTYSRGANGAFDPTAYNAYGYSFFGPKYADNTPRYNNAKNFFRNALTQQHNVTLEAGTPTLNYRLSGGYLNQEGVVPNTKLVRYNFRLTSFAELGKKFKLNTTIAYIRSDNDKATKSAGSFYTNLMTFPSDIDARDYMNPDGTRKLLRNVAANAELNNPFWDVNKNLSNDKTDNFVGNLSLTANIAKGLTATGIIGINSFTTMGSMFYHPYSREAVTLGGFLSTFEQVYNGMNGTFRVNYNKTIAKKFTNSFYLGSYFEDNKMTTNSQRGERFYEPDFMSIINTDPTSRIALLARRDSRKVRFYGGYTVGYNNLLYLTFTGTREGVSTLMSKFYNKQPFFNYGSASGSFIVSDLNFMKGVKDVLSYAKLRVSYATTGRGPIATYIIDRSFNGALSTGGGLNLGVTGNNEDLRPEFNKNFEVGGEFKFLKNRIGLDVAYFNNKIKDNILANRISYATGYILRYFNGGRLAAKGWEIQLTGSPVRSKNLNWDITLNFDKARTTIEKLPGDLPFYYDSDTWVFGSVRSQVAVGQSLANLSGFTFEKNNKGQLLISPTTGLPIQATTDYVTIGDRQPDFKFSLINSISYKNLSLAFNLDFRKGGDVFNANEMMMVMNGASVRTLDREQPRVITGVLKDGFENTDKPSINTIAITPYFRNNYYNGVIAESDYIESVNWMRLRDITISYDLSQKILKRQKLVKSANVFATGTDLFIVTNYSGMDPNVNALNSSNVKGFGGAGIDYGAIPTPRAFSLGVKLVF